MRIHVLVQLELFLFFSYNIFSLPLLQILSSLPIVYSFASALQPTRMTRIAVVTGANKGIGKAIAQNLACSGIFSHMILACRDKQRGEAAANEISKLPNAQNCQVSSQCLTIGDPSTYAPFRQSLEEQFGKVDVLINNAGMAFKGSDPTPFEQQCKPTLDVNFRGTVEFTEEMLPLVRMGEDARIVNVASMAGYLTQIKSKILRDQLNDPHLTEHKLCALVDQF